MNTNSPLLKPVSSEARIQSLDILRGFALLGILIMNIQSYALIQAAYINPAAFGDLTGINRWVWILSHIFGDQKFMTIFSILYGAGIVMITSRVRETGRSEAAVHYRRTWWLFVIGMLHAYLLWHGDILVPYAVCAVFVYFFRKISPRKLFITGLLIVCIPSLLYLLFGWSMQFWPPENIGNLAHSWAPAQDIVQREIAAFQGSWIQQMSQRVPAAIGFQTFIFLIWTGWRAGGLMLIGMAFYKWGILIAEKSSRFYQSILLIGFLVGLPAVILGIIFNFAANWSLEYSMFLGWQYNYWGSLFVAGGFIAAVMLICKYKRSGKLGLSLAAVGRTALSNYLLQTVVCTLIFYGHGFALFAKVERANLILIMFGIWIAQLLVSPLWLKYFRFGPAEWLWRSLTYMKIQPMRL
jgi:uncharacterized protein